MQCVWWVFGRCFWSILGAFRCHYQRLFSLVFKCFWDVVFLVYFVEFNRNWVPILWAGTLIFHAFSTPRFVHRFWMDSGSILEQLWGDFGSEKGASRTFQVMIWQKMLALVSNTFALLFLEIVQTFSQHFKCSWRFTAMIEPLRAAASFMDSLYFVFVGNSFWYDQSDHFLSFDNSAAREENH